MKKIKIIDNDMEELSKRPYHPENIPKLGFLIRKADELKSKIIQIPKVDLSNTQIADNDSSGSITPKYFKSPPLDTSTLPVEKNPFSDVTDLS